MRLRVVVAAGWRRREAMHSLDWTTGSRRFEFTTIGLSEDDIGQLVYDLEISDVRRLLWTSDSNGDLSAGRLSQPEPACPSISAPADILGLALTGVTVEALSQASGSMLPPSCADGNADRCRAAKLANWRRRTWRSSATLDSCGGQASEAMQQCKAVESEPMAPAGADEEQMHAEAPLDIWRHVLPDLREVGFEFRPGTNVLFVLRVFVRGPDAAECSASTARQIVEVFTHIH